MLTSDPRVTILDLIFFTFLLSTESLFCFALLLLLSFAVLLPFSSVFLFHVVLLISADAFSTLSPFALGFMFIVTCFDISCFLCKHCSYLYVS